MMHGQGIIWALMLTQANKTQPGVQKMCDYLILHVTKQQKLLWVLWIAQGFLTKANMFTWIIITIVPNFLRNYTLEIYLHVATVNPQPQKFTTSSCKAKTWKEPQKVIAFLDETMHYYVLDGMKRGLSLCLWP